MSIVVEYQRRVRGQVSAPLVLWALVMAVALFLTEARWAGSDGPTLALVDCVALGLLLGWRRRVAAVLIAPALSWAVAWAPLWVAAMIHHGVLAGLLVGLLLITVGWIGVAAAQILVVGAVALLVRALRGPGSSTVTVFGPDGRRDL